MPFQQVVKYDATITESLRHHYADIIEGVGEDSQRDGLLKTPERAAKAMQFLTQGYEMDAENILRSAMFRRRLFRNGHR